MRDLGASMSPMNAFKFIQGVETVSMRMDKQSQLSVEYQAASGVTPGYVRLSIGLEHIDDILADIGQALDKV